MKRVLASAIILVACAVPATAQNRGPRVSFLPQSEFGMSAEYLGGSDDDRFRWDANFGGELDLVDYTRGRMIFFANYEAILGEELQVFDPNQGNYVLEAAGSYRFGRNELFGVVHHASRHLRGRPKRHREPRLRGRSSHSRCGRRRCRRASARKAGGGAR